MKKKHQRLVFIIGGLLCCSAAIGYILYTASDNLMYFYAPKDIATQYDTIDKSRKIRVGGLVVDGSVSINEADVTFTLTDNTSEIEVSYEGILPNLFREGQGIIAEGHLESKQSFKATLLMAKHDENYIPSEVYNALKEEGYDY